MGRLLRLQLAPTVGRVGLGRVGFADGLVSILVNRAENAQRADEGKLAGRHVEASEGIGQGAGLPTVHAVEVGRVDAFRHARAVHHIVKGSMRFPMSLELFEQTVGVGKVQLQEVQARILQILTATRRANACQGLFYQKAADEAAGARYQDTLFHALSILQVLHVY